VEIDLERLPRLRITLQFAVPVALGLFYMRAAGHFDFTPDATYVCLRSAQNVAQGSGFAFNAGESVLSVAGPLWPLLIAAGTALGLDPFVVAKVLDLVFASFAILAFQALVLTMTENRAIAVVAAVALTFDAWLLQRAGTGMETSLALLLTLVAVRHAYMLDRLSFAAAAALLTLTRPEGALLFFWVLLLHLHRNVKVFFREWKGPVALYAGIVGLWVLYAVNAFGLSELVLGETPQAAVSMGEAVLSAAFVVFGAQGAPFLVMIAAVILLRRWLLGEDWRTLGLVIGWPLILVLIYIVQGGQSGPKYLVPMLPLILAGLCWILSLVEPSRLVSVRVAAVTGLAAVVISVGTSQAIYAFSSIPRMKSFTSVMQTGLKPMAYWIRNNSPRDAQVVAPEVGMIGYISERRVWEPISLVSRLTSRPTTGVSYDHVMTTGYYRSIVQPQFVIDQSTTKERLASDSLRPVMTAELTNPEQLTSGYVFLTLYRVDQ